MSKEVVDLVFSKFYSFKNLMRWSCLHAILYWYVNVLIKVGLFNADVPL